MRAGKRLVAIEVKSGRRKDALPGMSDFANVYRTASTLLVGADGITVDAFLSQPVEHLLSG